ncbi:AAA family ATPase [Cellulomonas palmilytica]|uniref:AAA family ATPase n=1 Tax=Cellulomonas palmilytica TaxID=2608402 RepID=UPI001F2CB32D|nr:SMC family ATPase [Cellulomonas palmilytica]UJP40720.1 SMC family ATPase [Cellulomonas palmilytica]
MRLLSLTLQAVGPFAGRHTVDFAELGASGLFLLEGPTGAGKSTLIDAVVFALYGKVASADASGDRVRSAYADDDTETFVDLVFEVAAGRYRVRRTPAFDRAKKRGTGTVRQQASVRLWRLTGDGGAGTTGADDEPAGEMLSTRLDEVGVEIQRLVGLDRAQFVQTIVLPQGEFARFLKADPEDRRSLLQKIFGTEVYERMQARLVEMRREADRATEATRRTVAERVAQLAGAARLDDELAEARDVVTRVLAGHGGADEVERALAAPLAALAAEAERDRAEADRLAAALEAARTAAEVGRRTVRLAERRRGLRAELVALEAGQDAYRQATQRLASARAARAVRPLLRAVDAASSAWDAAAKAFVAARDVAPADLAALVGDGEPVPGVAGPAVDRLVAARDDAVRAAAGLEHVVATEASLQSLRAEVTRARGAVEDRETEIAAHDAWLADRPAEATALAAALEEARTQAALEAAAAVTLEGARQRVEGHERLATLLVREERAEAEAESARRDAEAAVGAAAAARLARIAGLAGELAGKLVAGEDCPVCGSVEHPRPAALGADHVTADEVAAAEAALSRADTVFVAASEALARVRAEVAAARETTDGTTPDEARDALVRAQAALEAARAAGTEADVLAARLATYDEETEARRRARALAVAGRESAAMLVDVQTVAVEAAEAEVALARGEHPTVAARFAALKERAGIAADLRDALRSVADAGAELVRRTRELEVALAEHGFADVDAARAADLADDQADARDRLVRTHEAETARVQTGLAELADEPLLADVPEGAVPDIGAVLAAEQAAAEAAQAATAGAGVSRARAEAAQDAVGGVLAALDEHMRRLGDAAPVLRLAGLASGTGSDNDHALSLATYVLVRRFEDVVAAANARLVAMSDGRYELVRSDAKEDVSSRRRGLAMRVLDHHTEQQRDPRTLSGGETFYVSLCLALGMADVVTAEAGGIDLGTLFVDEGFGSLDPHTLDQVLAELDRLRAGGRVVGVVSHVDALKQTIADRVEVRRTAAGPSTLTVRAG